VPLGQRARPLLRAGGDRAEGHPPPDASGRFR
jgi:hypothetical protein